MSEVIVLLWQATVETLYMVCAAALFSALGGLVGGVLLVVTAPGNVAESPLLHRVLTSVVNIGRSIPFIILMVAVVPLTRWIVGTSIGTDAAIVPLILAAIPYVSRLVESALLEVDRGVIEAVISMGATPWQVIAKAYLPEAVPALLRALTIMSITLIGYSAMAGAIGGGGLGDLAIRYGYQRFRPGITVSTVVILVVIVQALQFSGDRLARYFDRRS
jgi:ABC-type methionine transport system permease subunit